MAQQRLIAGRAATSRQGPIGQTLQRLGRHYGLWLFIVAFLVPSVGAIVFYGFIAADCYISEARFTVRGVNSQQLGGLSVLLRTFGIDRSNDDSFAIHDYIESRDAVADLEKIVNLRMIFARRGADYFTKFGTLLTGETQEALYRHYLRMVELEENIETGITTMRVYAYRADDAKLIAESLLSLSEQRVNAINARARFDTVSFAEDMLRKAGEDVVRAQLALTRFRNAELLINPEQAAAGNFEVIATLSQELVKEQVRLQQMVTSSPSNPNIAPVRERVRSLEQQIAIERSKLTGSDEAIANKIGQYEELLMRRTLADNAYETASHSIEQARQEAARKQIYLEALVRPSLADESREPRRLRMIVTVAVLSLVAFVMCYLLVAGSREHLNLDT